MDDFGRPSIPLRRRLSRKATHGAALAALALIGGLLLRPDAATAQPAESCLARVEGAGARVWIAGSWSPLAPGPLPAGAAKVATSETARVEIACADGLIVTIGVGCEVNMDALLARGEPGVILQLMRGIVGLVTPERYARPVQVRTAVAVAAARSTAWLTSFDGEDDAAVFVREGAVLVDAGAAETLLRAGEGVDVVDGVLRPPVAWGQARIEATGAALGFGWP